MAALAQEGSESDVLQAACPLNTCDLPVDIVLRSKDNVLLGAHMKNLATFSEGFVPASFDSSAVLSEKQYAEYDENANVLEILLRFMHSEIPPDLRTLPFSLLLQISEAANKYVVYHAIPYCNVLLQQCVDSETNQCLDVMRYAHTYNDRTLQDKASLSFKSLTKGATFAIDSLGRGDHRLALAWVLQRRAFIADTSRVLLNPPVVLHRGGGARCSDWYAFYNSLAKDVLAAGLIVNVERMIDKYKHMVSNCKHCWIVLGQWRTEVTIRPISEFFTSLPQDPSRIQEMFAEAVAVGHMMSTFGRPSVVQHKGGYEHCDGWDKFYANAANQFLQYLPDTPEDGELRRILSLKGSIRDCKWCKMAVDNWCSRFRGACTRPRIDISV